MSGFERVTVLMEQTRTGRSLLLYVRELCRLSHSLEIELLHVVPYQPSMHTAVIPVAGSGLWISGEAIRRRDQQVAEKKKELDDLADELIASQPDCAVKTTVLFGSPLYETLDHTLNRETDLLVVGRHFVGDGQADEQATMARRITRKSACSVLVLPEYAFSFPTRILVPVRHSDCSAYALEVACSLAAPTNGLVFALNVYSADYSTAHLMPIGWEPGDLPATKARDENALLRERVENHGIYVEYLVEPDPNNHPEEKMMEAIDKTAANAVVIGARGLTGAAGVLLGKVTEKLISHCHVPVFAIKKKGEMIGVLRAILELSRR